MDKPCQVFDGHRQTVRRRNAAYKSSLQQFTTDPTDSRSESCPLRASRPRQMNLKISSTYMLGRYQRFCDIESRLLFHPRILAPTSLGLSLWSYSLLHFRFTRNEMRSKIEVEPQPRTASLIYLNPATYKQIASVRVYEYVVQHQKCHSILWHMCTNSRQHNTFTFWFGTILLRSPTRAFSWRH